MASARLSRALVGAVLSLPVPVPVLAGDWPDPSFIRDGERYAAVSTSGGWAPSFRILQSNDLSAWRVTGSVFRRPPRWAKGTLWAPELTRLNGRYAIFYSAMPRRKGSWYCLGVAAAPAAAGPYSDSGRPCAAAGTARSTPTRCETSADDFTSCGRRTATSSVGPPGSWPSA